MKSFNQSIDGPTWRAVLMYLEAGDTVIGIDEVGRGAWAGPVVAGAVVLPPKLVIPGVADSKVLSHVSRVRLDRAIRRQALAVGIGWVSAAEVDHQGLSWAVRESGLRALADGVIGTEPYMVVLDGRHNYLDGLYRSVAIVKADALVVPVSAASIVAKVARDRYMQALARRHVGYGFEKHKGYGTALHQAALRELGPSAEHRLSFKPLLEAAK